MYYIVSYNQAKLQYGYLAGYTKVHSVILELSNSAIIIITSHGQLGHPNNHDGIFYVH